MVLIFSVLFLISPIYGESLDSADGYSEIDNGFNNYAVNDVQIADTDSINSDSPSDSSIGNSNSNNINSNNNYNNNSTATKSSAKVEKSGVSTFASKVFIITDDNYSQYFSLFTGKLLSNSGISPGDTIKIGNVSNKAFIIDIPLTLTSTGADVQITNGVIHLVAGSDGSTISNLKIFNDKTDIVYQGVYVVRLHGIWLTNTNNNLIVNNSVQVADALKVFAMPMGWSSNNTIIYNRLISTWSTCMPMGQSHNNNISYNYLQTTAANIIYYNPFGHADYGGPADCYNNSITNNYLYAIYASDTTIGMQLVYAQHQNTQIINNTLVNQFYGISLYGINSTVVGNTLINMTAYAIIITSSNLLLENNTVIAVDAYYGGGIYVGGDGYNENITVVNNKVTITNGCYNGIIISGGNILVKDNIVNLYNFGVGINIVGNNTQILNNIINTKVDPGISLATSYAVIVGNSIRSGSYGIYFKTNNKKFYFTSIINNTIVSNDYGIFLQGTIYNTTIIGNKISTNASVGIFKDTTDSYGDNMSDNEVNDIIEDSTGIVIRDSNFYNYFDKDGYFKLGILDESLVLILTHLTNKKIYVDYKMTLLSNGLANLLTNVTIIVTSEGAGSVIRDLNFYNTNVAAIILENYVESIILKNNNITTISDNNYTGSVIGIKIGQSENILVEANNIYISSKKGFVYGISVTDSTYVFSKYINITQNSIILVGDNLVEGIYTDSMSNSEISNNLINLWGNGFGYGVATAYMKGNVNNITIKNNIIVVNVKKMAYLIELHISSNITIINNLLEGFGSGVYGVALYNSDNVSIIDNEIRTTGGDLSGIGVNYDVLGSGNSAIFLTSNSNNTFVKNNIIYTNARYQIIINNTNTNNTNINTTNGTNNTKIDLNNTFSQNYFVIDNVNVINYFTSNGEFIKANSVQANDTLLFNNLSSKHYNLIFNIPLNISFYKVNTIDATFIFKSGSAGSNVTGLLFNLTDNSAIILSDVYNITIHSNSIFINNVLEKNLTGIIIAHNSYDNRIINNAITLKGKNSLTGISVSNFYENRFGRSPYSNLIDSNLLFINSENVAKGIYVSMADNTKIFNNDIYLYTKNIGYAVEIVSNGSFAPYPTTVWSNNTKIVNNTFYGLGNNIFLIKSYQSYNTYIANNSLLADGNRSFAYIGYNTSGDKIEYNDIVVNGSGTNDNVNNTNNNHNTNSNTNNGSNGSFESWINVAQAGVYYSNSHNNLIRENNITSNYLKGGDYAVYVDDSLDSDSSGSNSSNGSGSTGIIYLIVSGNYLVSNNGLFIANDAIYGSNVLGQNNTPHYVYVSTNGSDVTGDGSMDNPFKTIFHAISQSYNRAIIYLLSGTYYENDIFVNKTITIKNNGNVTLNGKKGKIFIISNNGYLTIVGINFLNASSNNGSIISNNGYVNLMNCNFYNNTAIDQGGVIFNKGRLLIDNCSFYNNSAYLGGVISNFGNMSIANSKFINNSACSGGVIYSYHNCTSIISNSYFASNAARTDGNSYLYNDNETRLAPGHGGVIYNFGTLYSMNSTYEYNLANNGGVIANSVYIWREFNDSYLYILNSSFKFNNVTTSVYYGGYGGAIYGNARYLLVYNSVFHKNEAKTGGAINFSANNGSIEKSNFTNNTAESYGGALAINGNITIVYSIISNNSAGYSGGAVYYNGDSSYGHVLNQLNIFNSTIESNFAMHYGGAFYFNYANVNIKDSNILNNFAPVNSVIYGGNNGFLDFDNNWWGSNFGPSDDVWNRANKFKNWLFESSGWELIVGGGSSGSNSSGGSGSGSGNHIGPGTGSGLRPGGSGSGSGWGTGTGSGIGSGSGSGLGNGSGNGIGNGNGTGSGTGVDSNNGKGIGSNSTNNNILPGIGSIMDPSSSSSSNPGGKSGGGSAGGQSGSGEQSIKNSYEILEDTINNMKPIDFVYIILAVIGFIVLVIVGHRYNKRSRL